MATNRNDWWGVFWFCVFIVLAFLALAALAANQYGRRPSSGPPLPPMPVVVKRKAVADPVYTNGQFVCITNAKFGVHCFTWSNPPPPRTRMTLSWNVPGYFTGSPFKLSFTNHLLWSTNGPNGPWTGDIPVTCTNSNMFANIIYNPKVKAMFFKLGTNSF